jgi:hypothetical protein
MTSEHAHDPGHGDSIAAWTAVIIITLATAAGTLAFWFEQYSLVWLSGVVAVAGVAVGIVLARLGYGVNGKRK